MFHADTLANNQVQLAYDVWHQGLALPVLVGNSVAVARCANWEGGQGQRSSWMHVGVVQQVLQSEGGFVHPPMERGKQSFLKVGLIQMELLYFQ